MTRIRERLHRFYVATNPNIYRPPKETAAAGPDAEAIVRALAALDPSIATDTGDDVCITCDMVQVVPERWSSRPESHLDGCPWRLSREWVAQHPEEKT